MIYIYQPQLRHDTHQPQQMICVKTWIRKKTSSEGENLPETWEFVFMYTRLRFRSSYHWNSWFLLKFMGVWQIISNLIGSIKSIIYLLIHVVKNGPLNGEGPVFATQFGIRNGKVVTQLQKISLNSNKISSIRVLQHLFNHHGFSVKKSEVNIWPP